MFLTKAVRFNNGALSYGTLNAGVRMMKATQYDLHTRILQSINILDIILTTFLYRRKILILKILDHPISSYAPNPKQIVQKNLKSGKNLVLYNS